MYWAVGIPEGDPSAPLRCGRDDGTKGLTFVVLTAAHYSRIRGINNIETRPFDFAALRSK